MQAMTKNVFNIVVVALAIIGLCTPALREWHQNTVFTKFTHFETAPQVKVCPRLSPNISACVKESMESLRPLLKTGRIAPGFSIEGKSF